MQACALLTVVIPACAGEPSPLLLSGAAIWVYPRVCGGTASLNRRRIGVLGLSPRVRGNRLDTRLATTMARSIPACAGEPPPSLPP